MNTSDIKYKLSAFLLLMNFPLNSIAREINTSWVQALHNSAPEEFRQLFEPQEKSVNVVLVNGRSLSIIALVSDFQIKVLSDTVRQELYDFLTSNDISGDVADEVNSAFNKGMDSTTCKGNKETCTITLSVEEKFAVVIDNSAGRVRLIFSEQSYTKNTGKIDYVSSYNERLALINSPSLYTSYFGNYWNFNLNNRTTLGLPFGHVRSELYLTSSAGKQDFSLPGLVYDLETGPWRLLAGRSQEFNTFNSTSLLSLASLRKDGIYLLSSRNLARRGRESYQRLYFYVPQDGAVEIWRDAALIYSAPVAAGQQFISYEQLPAGNYNVKVKVKSGDNLLSEQVERIINTPDFQLNTGSRDITLGVARTRKENSMLPDIPLIEGDMIWRPWNPLQIGTGITATAEQQLFKVGGKWLATPSLTFSGVGAAFSDGRYYSTVSANWRSFNLNWSRYNLGQNKNNKSLLPREVKQNNSAPRFSDTLLGSSGYEQLMLSSHAAFGPGSGHLSVFYQRNDYESGGNGTSIGYNAGYNMPFIYNSQLGVNISANSYQNNMSGGRGNTTDNFYIGINFSMPLGSNTSLHVAPRWSKNTRPTTDASLQYNYRYNERNSGSLSIGDSLSGSKHQGKISGSLNMRQPAFNLTGNASIQSQSGGRESLFATISGSQIINSHGFWLSNSAAESYLIINDVTPDTVREKMLREEQGENAGKRPQAQLTLRQGDKLLSNQDYFAQGGEKIIPLEKYQSWSAKLHSAAFGVHNIDNDQIQGFSLPGSTLYLKTDYQPEYQIIGAFNDSQGRPLSNIECQGTSCLRVDKLDDGLFKIILKGQDYFRLVSSDMLCLPENGVSLTQSLTRLYDVKCERLRSGNGPQQLAKKDPQPQAPVAAHLSQNRARNSATAGEVSSSFSLLSDLMKEKRLQPEPSTAQHHEAWRFGVFHRYENALRLSRQLENIGMAVRIKEIRPDTYAVYGTPLKTITPRQRELINKYGAVKQTTAPANAIATVAMK